MKKNQYKLILRIVHFIIVAYLLFGIFYIYYSALTKRTNSLLIVLVISLFIEGLIIYLNHGNCPLGFIQKKAGDNTPFFELVLPKKQAKLAVRFFALITLIGIVLMDIRFLTQ